MLPMPKGAGSASAMAAEASPSPSLHHLQHRPVQPQQSQTLSLQSHMQAQQHCAQHMQPMGAAAGGYDAGGCMHMQGLNDRVGMSTDSAFGSVQAAGLSTGRSMELGEAMESSPMKQQASRHMHSFATSGSLPCTSCQVGMGMQACRCILDMCTRRPGALAALCTACQDQECHDHFRRRTTWSSVLMLTSLPLPTDHTRSQGPSLAPTPSVTTAAASLMTRQQLVTALAHEQAQREASERACAELSARLQAAEERVGTLLARMNMPGPSCPRISGEEVLERLSDMLDVVSAWGPLLMACNLVLVCAQHQSLGTCLPWGLGLGC